MDLNARGHRMLVLLTLAAVMSVSGSAQTRNVSFKARHDFPAVGAAGGAAVADFRGNGSKDIVISNSLTNSSSISILPSNGDGTFATSVPFSTGGLAPAGLAVGDVNSDGKPDVVVANRRSNNVSVLLGSGNDRLQNARVFSVGQNPAAVALGDLNNDGKLDVVVANGASNNVSVLLGNGDGTLRPAANLVVGIQPSSVVIGRFHGNGAPADIVVANFGNSGQNNGSVSILIGNGNGTFQGARNILTGGNPVSLTTAELSGDSNADLAVADALQSVVFIEAGNGNGTFRALGRLPVLASPSAVTVADFHGDGRQRDLVVVSGGPAQVAQAFFNAGNGAFFANPAFAVSQNPAAVAAADFNRDGRTDVVSASQLGDISVLLGTGLGRFISASSVPAGSGAEYIISNDFNGDGNLDVAVANELSNSVSILLGGGNGTFAPKRDFTAGSKPFALATGDFNGDRKLDLVVVNSGTFPSDPGNISILLGNGDGTFQSARNTRVGNIPVFAAVGDFNKDGKQDLAVANFVDNTVSILRGSGNGSFTPTATISFPPFSQIFSTFVADLDGDHNEDLIVGGGSDVWVLQGNGLGNFSQPQMVHAGFTGSFAVGDFDGDTHPDLAIIDLNTEGSSFVVDVLLGNGNRTFRTAGQFPFFGGFATQIVTGDLNGDGKLDLAVTSLNTLSVVVLTGNGDGSFTTSSNANFGVTAFAQSLTAGDFNRDGRLDVAVTGVASTAASGSSTGAVSLLINNTQ